MILAAKQCFGHDHIWPKPLLAQKNALGHLFFVTAFGQTAFSQNLCFGVLAMFGQMCSCIWLGVLLCPVVVVCGIFGRVQHLLGRVPPSAGPQCARPPSSPDRSLPPDRSKFRSFLSRSTAPISLFLSLSGCLLVEFWCLKAGTLKRARLGSQAVV